MACTKVTHDPEAAEAALRTFMEAWKGQSVAAVKTAVRRVGVEECYKWFRDIYNLVDETQ